MKAKIIKVNGLKFYVRQGTSDEKTVIEVVKNNTYEKRGITIEKGEKWVDLGGNIGAFTILAISKGATVTTYEPDPQSYQMILKNLALNNLTSTVINKAVVCHNKGFDYLSISKTNQFWRNSLMKDMGGGTIKVETINFKDCIKSGDCVKMDIEGSEMPIIEKWNIEGVKKMVYEWSFDIDDSILRYKDAIEKMQRYFKIVVFDKYLFKHERWLKTWFPACKNVICQN
jgi:FkbM family methyltransferase